MKTPPGFQLLHCLKSSCEGGESIFIDGYRCASEVFRRQEDAFDALASFPVSFRYNAPGRAYFDTKPTIEIDEYAKSFSNVGRHSKSLGALGTKVFSTTH